MVFPGGSGGTESTCNAGDLSSIPRLGRSPGGGHGNPLSSMDFPGGSDGKESTCHRRPGFHPWVGNIPGEWNSHPDQYSGLENSMDGGAWQATVHETAKSWT